MCDTSISGVAVAYCRQTPMMPLLDIRHIPSSWKGLWVMNYMRQSPHSRVSCGIARDKIYRRPPPSSSFVGGRVFLRHVVRKYHTAVTFDYTAKCKRVSVNTRRGSVSAVSCLLPANRPLPLQSQRTHTPREDKKNTHHVIYTDSRQKPEICKETNATTETT